MNLKNMRTEAGLTQQNIADALNVNRSNVARWETGVALPRADKLKPLALLLNCTVDELLEGGVVE